MNKVLCVLAAALALSSCGKLHEKFGRLRGGTTSVSFQVEGRNPSALLPGIMVYAVRANDVKSRGARFVASEIEQPNWLIPNGSYHFFAFGYASGDMLGNMYCGSVLNKSLTGGSATISLVLDDQGQCGLPPFSPPGFGTADTNQTRPLYLAACDPSTGDISLTDATSNPCNGAPRPAAGAFNSYRMEFHEFERWNPNEPPHSTSLGLSTGCVPGAFVGSGVTANRSPPYGEIFVTDLSIYSDSGCTTYIGSFTMTEGILHAGNNATVRFRDATDTLVTPPLQRMKANSGSSTVHLFLRNY